MPPPTDHPWPAWFQDTVQHAQLLTNRTLRQYFLGHSAERWPELAKATLLYGVLCLQRDFPGQPVVPVEQLHEACRQLHAEAALGAALPRIRSQFSSLEEDLGGFLAELDLNAPGSLQPQQPPRHTTSSSAGPHGNARPAAAIAAAPSSARSAPTSARVAVAASAMPPPPPPKAKQPAIYPEWWPKDAAASTAARRRSAASKHRPPPRLAYSRPTTAPADPVRDDLATAALLLVPPRVNTSRTSSQQGAPRQAESKVRLQHAQRLALQRQQQEAEVWRSSGSVPTTGNDAAASEHYGTQAASSPGEGQQYSPRYDPVAVAKWRQHFGLG